MGILWQFWKKAIGCEPDDKAPVFATIAGKRLVSVKKNLGKPQKASDLLTEQPVRAIGYILNHCAGTLPSASFLAASFLPADR